MSGANISAEQASYDAIRKAVSNLQADINALNGQVRNEVATVVGSWQGGTSQAFASVMNDWNEGSNRATTALTEFDQSLASVSAERTRCTAGCCQDRRSHAEPVSRSEKK